MDALSLKSERAKEALSCGALALVVAVMLGPALLGDRPIGFDHTAQYFQAWQMKENLFRHGPYFWSHLWFAGYPANYGYPIGAYLAITLLHYLTLGLLGFSRVYAIAFALFYFLHGYALYYLGRKAFDRPIGLMAAILYLLDRGAPFSGGWFWIVDVGTWPVALGIALGLLAAARLGDVIEAGGRRNLAAAGLFIGLSLLSHPLQTLYFAILAIGLLLVLFTGAAPRELKRPIRELALAGLIGLSIGALWLLPFLSSVSFQSAYGMRWISFPEIGARLYGGELFPGSASMTPPRELLPTAATSFITPATDGLSTYITVIAVLVLPFLIFSRRALVRLVGLMSLLFMLCAATTLHDLFDLPHLMKTYGSIEFTRFSMLIKPFWNLAAAAGLLTLWRAARDRVRWKNNFPAWAVVALCALPLYLPATLALLDRHLLQTTRYESQDPLASDRHELVQWLNQKVAEDPRFFRVAALGNGRDDHSLIDLGTELTMPIFHLGFTPTLAFKYEMMESESFNASASSAPEILEALNVRYLLVKEPLSGDFKPVESFGRLILYELPGWKSDPFVVEGTGRVELVKFSPEEIVLKASSESRGKLRLNVSWFDRWHATRNGQPLEITPTRVGNNPGTGFMTVDLASGTYRFWFGWCWPEGLGIILFLGGLATCVILSPYKAILRRHR